MAEKMTQEQRLDTLVEAFKADSVQYKDLQMPADTEGKRRILRSLIISNGYTVYVNGTALTGPN